MERTTFCLLFYIRRTKLNRNGEAPIMMRITVNGVRVDASVKKTILPEFWSAAKGKALEKKREYKELNLYLDSIRRSNATVVMSLGVLFLFIFILSILEPQASLMALTFECVSALSTVGSSLNLTPNLCDASKLLVALLMFIGRVGLITLMLGIIKQKKNTKYRYPSDNIIIN